MGWLKSEEQVTLTCHKCKTRHRVRSARTLRDGVKSTCRRCGTRFGVCVVPTHEPSAESDQGDALPVPELDDLQPETHRFSFWGSGGSLFGIHIVNFLLTAVSFGIYTFWAKVRVRKYLWSQSQFLTDRFAYHGTGAELFKGFLKAAVIFGVPYFLLGVTEGFAANTIVRTAASLLGGCMALIFIPVAIVAARRYRLSRTSWRGIRFSFRGSIWEFIKLFVTGMVLNVLTLGIYYPFFDVRNHAYLISHTYFGNQSFRFTGTGWALAKQFLIAYLLTPFTLGFSWIWYMAAKRRYFWEQTSMSEARFHFPISGWDFFKLKFGNLLLLVLTLGFAWPWVTTRNLDFALSNLTLQGPSRLDVILQEAQSATATGEGLDGFLDTGFELG